MLQVLRPVPATGLFVPKDGIYEGSQGGYSVEFQAPDQSGLLRTYQYRAVEGVRGINCKRTITIQGGVPSDQQT